MERCSAVKAEHEGVVRLMVVILVNRGNGIGLVSILNTVVLMVVAYKYYCIIIYSMALVGLRPLFPMAEAMVR